jgi:uncharacterized membrane protein YeaQ/YmgE (transglycosylase-associated protein family)
MTSTAGLLSNDVSSPLQAATRQRCKSSDATTTEASVIGFIITLLIVGAIAGFLARLLVPGPDPMSVPVTILVGIIGSFVGGFLGWALFGKDFNEGALQPSGIIGSIIGAVIVVLAYRLIIRRRAGTRRR